MAAKLRGMGFIIGLAGFIVWAGSIFLNIPSFLGSSNRFNIFIEYITRLDPINYILPLAFICFAVFSFMKLRTASLASSSIAMIMSLAEIYNTSSISADKIALIVIAAISVILSFLKKN